MPETQNFKNHARYQPVFHYVLLPILLFHLVYTIVRLVQEQSFDRFDSVLIAIALIILAFLARLNPLRAQDRIIRLEEALRYQRVLPTWLLEQTENLKNNEIVALRFASDEELPFLMERVLRGELTKSVEIKSAIKNWRTDNLRV